MEVERQFAKLFIWSTFTIAILIAIMGITTIGSKAVAVDQPPYQLYWDLGEATSSAFWCDDNRIAYTDTKGIKIANLLLKSVQDIDPSKFNFQSYDALRLTGCVTDSLGNPAILLTRQAKDRKAELFLYEVKQNLFTGPYAHGYFQRNDQINGDIFIIAGQKSDLSKRISKIKFLPLKQALNSTEFRINYIHKNPSSSNYLAEIWIGCAGNFRGERRQIVLRSWDDVADISFLSGDNVFNLNECKDLIPHTRAWSRSTDEIVIVLKSQSLKSSRINDVISYTTCSIKRHSNIECTSLDVDNEIEEIIGSPNNNYVGIFFSNNCIKFTRDIQKVAPNASCVLKDFFSSGSEANVRVNFDVSKANTKIALANLNTNPSGTFLALPLSGAFLSNRAETYENLEATGKRTGSAERKSNARSIVEPCAAKIRGKEWNHAAYGKGDEGFCSNLYVLQFVE